MKKFSTFILLATIFSFGFKLSSGSGIKITKNTVQLNKHNPQMGLTVLEKRTNHKLEIKWNNENSSPVFVGGTLTLKGYAVSSDKSLDAKKFLSENVELFGIKDPASELSVISNSKDKLSMTHIKYQQQINGIKIFDSQLIVHVRADGAIESVNGRFYPTPVINTTPQISESNAIKIAKEKLGSYKADNEQAELMILNSDDQLKLTYEITLPSFWTPNMKVYVDAMNGKILKVDDGIRYDGPKVGSGLDLNGNSQTIHTMLLQGKYYMIDASLPMFHTVNDTMQGTIETYDAQNDTAGNGYNKAAYITDPNNDNNFNDNMNLRAAVSAHLNSRKVYEFYKSHYGRESYDDKKASVWNVVHYKQNYNNAFWNGVCLTYGDGDGVAFSNLAGAFDVITHEFTHAVNSSTANLIYELQPGAMSESMSDVFACLADSTNWLIGEDVTTPNIPGDGLRNMADPHNGKPNGDLNAGWLPANMSEYVQLSKDESNDYGGVHINCGILNKAFYNVATAIGRWKAGQIWYRSLTIYLTNNSQFEDLRTACLNSAKDLYGNGSTEYNAVDNGFKEVGLDGTSGNETTTELSYADGNPEGYVWEDGANWALATKFTPTVSNAKISKVSVYLGGIADIQSKEVYSSGLSSTLSFAILKADGTDGFPGTLLGSSDPVTVSGGLVEQNTPNISINGDFYVACLYQSNTYQPAIAADNNGNGRAYEYNPNDQKWYSLGEYYGTDYNVNLYIKAVITSVTGVTEVDSKIPNKFEISSNYPNPFNPSTSIKYSLPVAEDVKIAVYDLTGKEIATLVNNYQNAGVYTTTWNGKNNSGSQVASGVYLYRIKAGNFVQTHKMLLLK